MNIIQHPSPNFNDRPDGASPSYIILHYTGMKTGVEALTRLCDPEAEVSAHYFVEEDGQIYQLVADDKRAWHAGKSYWKGEPNLNATSIGIEIVNPGHAHGYRGFPEGQIDAVKQLCASLIHNYKIESHHILGHSDIAPERKWYDPGELFPWAKLAEEGVGIWPKPEEEDFEQAKDWDLDQYVCACHTYGYDSSLGYEFVLRAFERHFAPELILGTSQDELTARARLAYLLRTT